MANTTVEVMRRINADPEYVNLFRDAFGRDPDLKGLTHAIASFERVMISSNSRFDQFEQGDSTALTPDKFFEKALGRPPVDEVVVLNL